MINGNVDRAVVTVWLHFLMFSSHCYLFSFCPISGHAGKKAWMLLSFETVGNSDHSSPTSHAGIFSPALPTNYHRSQASLLSCSLKTFYTNLEGMSVVPRKFCYMSNKSYYLLGVCAIISLSIRTKVWVRVHPVYAEWPQKLYSKVYLDLDQKFCLCSVWDNMNHFSKKRIFILILHCTMLFSSARSQTQIPLSALSSHPLSSLPMTLLFPIPDFDVMLMWISDSIWIFEEFYLHGKMSSFNIPVIKKLVIDKSLMQLLDTPYKWE